MLSLFHLLAYFINRFQCLSTLIGELLTQLAEARSQSRR